jgi:hypothetical protein
MDSVVGNVLSKEDRKFARNRAVEIIDQKPEIKVEELAEKIRELVGCEANKIAREAFEFQRAIVVALEYFIEKNRPGNGFDAYDVEIGTMEARKKAGTFIFGKPMEAAFFIAHKRYLKIRSSAKLSVAEKSPALVAETASEQVAPKKESRVLVNGRPISELVEDPNSSWYLLFSEGMTVLLRNSKAMLSEVIGRVEDALHENNLSRDIYNSEMIAIQAMESHREYQMLGLKAKEFLDQPGMAGCADVCLIADKLMFLFGSLSEQKLAKKRVKLRAAIREEMRHRGTYFLDREMDQDKPRQILPKEVVVVKTGKTQKRRESGALARHQQNRSDKATINQMRASGRPSGGGGKRYNSNKQKKGGKKK